MNGVILVQYVRTLGKGHFGVTEEVSLRGRSACLKEPLRGTVDTDELRALMAIPPQRNTMQFIGIACRGRKLCLLCKLYGGGSVDKLHTTEDFLRDDRFLRALQDICRGVAHLHEHSIVHRDLACRNLLMDTDGTLVVGDYGLARKMEEEKQMYVRAYVGGAMTQFPLAWTAPEALRTKKFTKKYLVLATLIRC